jgi:tetratricopeptide (TPR) repeat protein
MNGLFLEYRDPLFSIILFFTIIFIVTFFSYFWGRYKRKEDYHHLNKFLKQFQTVPSSHSIKDSMQNDTLSENLWLLLASAYYKNGEYEHSIEIYNELLHKANILNRKEVMFLLGKTYFKAGFLERSKQIFLEILKYSPRTPQALHYLLLVYEYMREYKSALDVLEPLDELKEDVTLEDYYLKVLIILQNTTLHEEEKALQLLHLYNESKQLTYVIFEYLFRVNPKLAWENLALDKVELIVDILWHLDKKDVNLDIIAKNTYLQELYTAKGYVDFVEKSDVFEFDLLIKLSKKANATLNFEYGCSTCKGNFPFAFHRCSQCHCIDTMYIEWSLGRDYSKDFSEENNSFQ